MVRPVGLAVEYAAEPLQRGNTLPPSLLLNEANFWQGQATSND